MEKNNSDVKINSLMRCTKLKGFPLFAVASISVNTILICIIATFLGIQHPDATAGHAGSLSISVEDSRTPPSHRPMTPWPSLQLNPHSLLTEFALFGSHLAWPGSSCQLDTGVQNQVWALPWAPLLRPPLWQTHGQPKGQLHWVLLL